MIKYKIKTGSYKNVTEKSVKSYDYSTEVGIYDYNSREYRALEME
jgi:hypothetical protein